MAVEVAVMFGGGALGAFGCGVWQALAPRLRHARIVGAGGTSIGAINAAFVARHGVDVEAGADAMQALWRQDIATPSVPFLGLSGQRDVQGWNGFLTGLLVGTRGLQRPQFPHWNPLTGLDRLHHPVMDRSRMWALLGERLGAFNTSSAHDPVLGAAAVDVMSGKLRLFDSVQGAVEVAHLCASAAIPLLYEPVTIDDRLYWDGDMTHEAALPLFLATLRATGRLQHGRPRDTTTLLITIDQMSESIDRLPASGIEMAYRALDLLMHGKMALLPDQREGLTHVLAIRRRPLPHDGISGQFDYSPERVAELIEQGMAQAEEAWNEAGIPE